MAGKRSFDEQNRREAQYWASEWRYKQKRKKILIVVVAALCIAAAACAINYISVISTRTTYSSEAEMKKALQGRFEQVRRYEDIVIDGNRVKLTYYAKSHYDEEYARNYGYSEYGDSTYEDYIVKWDYRRGKIECDWMDDIIVDKNGRLVYYGDPFVKTDEPAPVPFDPSILKDKSGSEADVTAPETETSEEEQADAEAEEKSLEETQEAAAAAGVLPAEEGDEI
jgi:hypothetical protein